MTINLSGELRYDTRGLPEGYDPHKLYEYRRDTLVKDASDLESFLYKYIPWTLIKSFAFAIDPTAPFKVAPGVITPANRTKWRQIDSVTLKRKLTRLSTSQSSSHGPNFHQSNCWDPTATWVNNSNTVTSNLNSQGPIVDYLKDTTRRTRLFGSDNGELELFKSYVDSPPRTWTTGFVRDDLILTHLEGPEPGCVAAGGINNPGTTSRNLDTYTVSPSGAIFPYRSHSQLRTSEIAYNKALASKHAISMLRDWSPNTRSYSLFRNVVELKDIPHSITQLRDTLGDLRKLFVSLGTQPKLRKSIFDLKASAGNVPGEYLSYHFGWKQTWKDVNDLLSLPEKLTKKYNFLIDRAGKPTTFRSKRNIPFATDQDLPGFEYEMLNGEYDYELKTRIQKESELRLVINATFDFPPINPPAMRWDHFADRIGAIPRVTDLYNLVPWTWLVDWFTGLGNYVECIDNIAHDDSLINWGMITCSTKGKLVSTWRSKSDLRSRTRVDYVVVEDHIDRVQHTHTSTLNFECQTRSDVAQILGVKQTSVPSTLSSYQKSILGALLAQRNQHFRLT